MNRKIRPNYYGTRMLETPDLSGFKGSFAKPAPKGKKPPKPLRAGTKTKQWEEDRSELKKEFAAAGVTECELRYEGCWRNNALTFAHKDKRQNLTPEEIRHAAILACTPCHQVIEQKPSAEMRKEIEAIIQSRDI